MITLNASYSSFQKLIDIKYIFAKFININFINLERFFLGLHDATSAPSICWAKFSKQWNSIQWFELIGNSKT